MDHPNHLSLESSWFTYQSCKPSYLKKYTRDPRLTYPFLDPIIPENFVTLVGSTHTRRRRAPHASPHHAPPPSALYDAAQRGCTGVQTSDSSSSSVLRCSPRAARADTTWPRPPERAGTCGTHRRYTCRYSVALPHMLAACDVTPPQQGCITNKN
jgi:hypothetical protein